MGHKHHAEFHKKLMSQSLENFWTDRRTDGQTLFYRTLPATAAGPTKDLHLSMFNMITGINESKTLTKHI